MLGLSVGPVILSAYRKRNSQVAVKPQHTYMYTYSSSTSTILYNLNVIVKLYAKLAERPYQ